VNLLSVSYWVGMKLVHICRISSNCCNIVLQSIYHGFPAKPTAIAYDPVLELLAIGNKSGDLRL